MRDLVLKYFLRKTRSWSFLYEFREWHNTGTIWKAITDMLRYLPIDCYNTSSNGNPAIHQSVSPSVREEIMLFQRDQQRCMDRSQMTIARETRRNTTTHQLRWKKKHYKSWRTEKTNSSCSNRRHPPSGDSHQYKKKKRKLDGSDGTRYWSGFCLFGSTLMDKQKSGQTKVSPKKKGRRKV